jgi:hypothetical protein
MRRRRAILATAIVVALVTAPVATVRAVAPGGAPTALGGAPTAPGRAPSATVLTVGRPATNSTIPAGFLGLSLEYFAIPTYAGTNPAAVDPVFLQLIRNLSGGNPPELRIGGDTTDRTWWPMAGVPTPAGVTNVLTPAWIAETRALAARLRARLTLGINFEADNAGVAATEADRLLAGIGRKRVAALELGNEPELYGTFTWGLSGLPGRPKTYDYGSFSSDFTRIAAALPPVPLAGPTVGVGEWFPDVGPFLSAHRQVAVATLHRYPLESCYVTRRQPSYPTIPHLLSFASTQALANSVAAAVRAAQARRVPVRIDEINTISCGWDPAVSRSFASALWALEVSFELARVGVDGIDLHTFPGATYALFRFSRAGRHWQGVVNPEYYGLEMFTQAAPAGSRLLDVSPAGARRLKAFATLAPDGKTRIVVINEGAGPRVVDVRASGTTGTGTLELLTAPAIGATRGVTLGGQTYGKSTTTGRLAGARRTDTVAPTQHGYRLSVPPASAVMLTLLPGTVTGGRPRADRPVGLLSGSTH